jgi:tRNA pseudouridine55 synthase
MFGVLNLDKPPGVTSRDMVDQVQRLVRPLKVGHAGTLDPLASGVLLVCVGPATRLVPYLHRYSKTYLAEFLLGVASASDDTETELEPLAHPPQLTQAQVAAALPKFTGRILQTPPAHSAVRVGGRRAYHLARRGVALDLEPREVDVHCLELLALAPERMTLKVECSSGTYIRSLGRDLAAALGSAAVMSGLQRTRIGPFALDAAAAPAALTRETLSAVLLPPRLAVEPLMDAVTVSPDEASLLRRGLAIPEGHAGEAGAEVAACDGSGVLVAITVRQPGGRLAPRLVFPLGNAETRTGHG